MDVEGIERATLEAVSPDAVVEMPDWLVALDPGTISRARSAAPLRHDLGPERLDDIEALYAQAGLPAAFRLSDAPGLDAVRVELTRRGYRSEWATVVKLGEVAAMAALSDAPAEVAESPDEAWGQVFLGEGFDPVDGACRVRALGRANGSVFASVREEGRALAVGVASFSHGWASIHGMRTEMAHRGKGLAGRVLAGLARAAEARGIARVFLQVEEGNAPARALYRRAGFAPAWRYWYWGKPTPARSR